MRIHRDKRTEKFESLFFLYIPILQYRACNNMYDNQSNKSNRFNQFRFNTAVNHRIKHCTLFSYIILTSICIVKFFQVGMIKMFMTYYVKQAQLYNALHLNDILQGTFERKILFSQVGENYKTNYVTTYSFTVVCAMICFKVNEGSGDVVQAMFNAIIQTLISGIKCNVCFSFEHRLLGQQKILVITVVRLYKLFII